MRPPFLAILCLILLRVVVGLHFFLEGSSHLRDPDWSSVGFRRAAVGPLADRYRSVLPEVGGWSETLGRLDDRDQETASAAWAANVERGWRDLLAARSAVVPLDEAGKQAAEEAIAAARKDLGEFLASIAGELSDYRLELARLAGMERRPEASGVPFERSRVAAKRRELDTIAADWMAAAEGLGRRLVAEWNEPLTDEQRRAAESAVPPSPLWKADRFVSWSLATIGACLVLGFLVKFNAMGGAIFLASVVASQPFWIPGAAETYDQWVELSACLVLASMPRGGWSGLDYFLGRIFCGRRRPAS
jgi:uncharacterized membrane protein YphA (DoxX/SURF4 family)